MDENCIDLHDLVAAARWDATSVGPSYKRAQIRDGYINLEVGPRGGGSFPSLVLSLAPAMCYEDLLRSSYSVGHFGVSPGEPVSDYIRRS